LKIFYFLKIHVKTISLKACGVCSSDSYTEQIVNIVKVKLRFSCEIVFKKPLLRQQIPSHQATEYNGEIVKAAATFCLI